MSRGEKSANILQSEYYSNGSKITFWKLKSNKHLTYCIY